MKKLKNVILDNIAVSDEDGLITFSDHDDSYLARGLFEKSASRDRIYNLAGLRFDSFIKKHNIIRIDLLKSNIEGAERYLVNSISRENIARVNNVAISCHDFRYTENKNDFFLTKGLVSTFLLENGFNIEHQNTGEPHVDDWIYGTRPQ